MKKVKGSPLLEAVKVMQQQEILEEGHWANANLMARGIGLPYKNCLTYNERNRLKAAERKEAAAEKRKLFRKERPLVSWKKLFPGNLWTDDYGSYIFDSTNQMVLHSMEDAFIGLNATSPETRLNMRVAMMQMIAEVMGYNASRFNEAEMAKYLPYRKMVLDAITLPLKQVDGECIADSSGVELAVARGWGYLTGVKKYPAEKAAAIQEQMIADICAAFNEKYYKKEEQYDRQK